MCISDEGNMGFRTGCWFRRSIYRRASMVCTFSAKSFGVFNNKNYRMNNVAWVDSVPSLRTTDNLYPDNSLDSVGIAGFSHDFHALEGKNPPVVDVFESFSDEDTSWLSRFVFLMGPVLPILQNLPTKQNKTLKRLRTTMGEIADELLARNREEKDGKSIVEEKSIIGLLSECSVVTVKRN